MKPKPSSFIKSFSNASESGTDCISASPFPFRPGYPSSPPTPPQPKYPTLPNRSSSEPSPPMSHCFNRERSAPSSPKPLESGRKPISKSQYVDFLSPTSRTESLKILWSSRARMYGTMVSADFDSSDDEAEGQHGDSTTREVLPAALVPKHYNIYLAPDLESFEYNGTVSIDVDVVESTNTVVLNSKKLMIHKAFIRYLNSTLQATAITFDQEKEQVTFAFEEEIPAGSTATVTVDFVGVHNDAMTGFYRSSYDNVAGEKQLLVVTQFEATDARQAFPCFDEPGLKATFDSTLVVAEDLIALSNMNVISTTPFINAAGKKVKEVKFATTPIMSTYVTSCLRCWDFEYIETTATPKRPVDAQEITVRVYTVKGQVERGQFALNVGARTLEYFSEYFNTAYHLSKMDMISIPDFGSGAMENWGLVTYRTETLLCDEKTSTAAAKGAIASMVGHELAHQWFDHLFPEWNIFTQFVTSELAGAFSADGLRSSHPIQVEVNSAREIMQIFDGISYLKEFKFKNTVTDDLWKHLSASSGIDVPLLLTGPISIVFGEKQGTITFPYDSSENAFWKLNSGASGLYRVKYTDAQIASIGRILKTNLNTFTVGDRIHNLDSETDFNVLTQVEIVISNLRSYSYQHSDVQEGIKTLGRNVFAPVVAKLGYEFPAGEDYEVAQTRVLAIGASDKEALHPEIKTFAICAALSNTTEENAEEANEIRWALGAINSAHLVDRLLNEVVFDASLVRPQDILNSISGISYLGYNRVVILPLLIKYFQTNFKRVQASVGKDVVDEVRAWTRGDGLEGADLEERKKDVAGIHRFIDQTLESVETNTMFFENQLQALQSFFSA
ncbi:hypothetical protein BCR33DRAFT_848237 [Rhizoclosmatium globosum]|uniref:Aminopeptidase n=1 Tax=Rhizoclosmatium globosum TaxID=329046 RepID=A0A1Y2CMF7_9FUNG|nr:hypothetical protein BCR33DRAFT_848237 [Rhizoclosmatium globosum]|eukprot:ORY48209.1 hypothetical protein BCR33DRAFT_848237 [Rhizoclosmatium globosum]